MGIAIAVQSTYRSRRSSSRGTCGGCGSARNYYLYCHLEKMNRSTYVRHLLCLRLWTQVGPAKPVGSIAATAKAKERIERCIMLSKMVNKTNVLSKRRKVVKDKTRCKRRTSSVKRSTEKQVAALTLYILPQVHHHTIKLNLLGHTCRQVIDNLQADGRQGDHNVHPWSGPHYQNVQCWKILVEQSSRYACCQISAKIYTRCTAASSL